MVPRSEWLQELARLGGPRLVRSRRAAARVGEFALVLSWLVLSHWWQPVLGTRQPVEASVPLDACAAPQ